MAQVFTAEVRVTGQLATTLAAMHTVPTGETHYINSLDLGPNQNAADQAVELKLYISGALRNWKRLTLKNLWGAEVLDDGKRIMLRPGDEIRGLASNTNAVDYFINAVKEVTV